MWADIFKASEGMFYLSQQNDFIGLSSDVVPEHFQYKKMAEKRIQTNYFYLVLSKIGTIYL